MKGKKKDKNLKRKKNIDIDQKREQRKQYFFVIRELTSREIKRKYSRSYLGIVWSVLNPLLSMSVLSMIFTQLFRRSIENYPIYYLSGYILWHMFTTATTAAMTTLVDNKQMLIKVRLPMEVFVVARVYTAFVNLGYSLVAYVIMLVVFQVTPKLSMLFFPVVIILLLIFALGISFFLSTAYVFFGDIKHLYSVLLTLWMYCSALFYPVDRLEGVIRKVIEINPIFNYIDAVRNIVLNGTLPPLGEFVRMVVWAVGVFGVGYYIFRKNRNNIMQKI